MLVKKKFAKTVAVSLVLVLLVPVIAYGTSYSSSLNFRDHVRGAKRSYSAGTMSISMTAYSKPSGSNDFTVELYKDNLIIDTKLGKTKFTSTKAGKANSKSFGKVSKGNYRFEFDDAPGINDIITISSDVKMQTK